VNERTARRDPGRTPTKKENTVKNREGYERDLAILVEDALITGDKVDLDVIRKLAADYGEEPGIVIRDLLAEAIEFADWNGRSRGFVRRVGAPPAVAVLGSRLRDLREGERLTGG
jgi:hypothetical protein